MEADISGPGLAAPQFSRAVPAGAAGRQPAGDTPGMGSTAQGLAVAGRRTGCLSEDAPLRHTQDPDHAVRGLQLRNSDPLRWSGTLMAEKNLRAHVRRLGNAHTRVYSCVRMSGDVRGGRLKRGKRPRPLFLLGPAAPYTTGAIPRALEHRNEKLSCNTKPKPPCFVHALPLGPGASAHAGNLDAPFWTWVCRAPTPAGALVCRSSSSGTVTAGKAPAGRAARPGSPPGGLQLSANPGYKNFTLLT